MKYLKGFKIFENNSSWIDRVNNIHAICKKYRITNYTINDDDWSIDVNNNVYFQGLGLTKIPLKFRNVIGYFSCSNNQLTTLEGSPKHVGGYFSCSNNQLTSLEGSPKHVGGYFSCSNNQLTSLEGAPRYVGRYLDCISNKITTLEHFPEDIPDLLCSGNPIYNIWDLFMDTSKIEIFNEYDIIREVDGKPAIVLDRLNAFLEEIEKPTVKGVDGWINI
jgi:hypothetical protein